MERSLGIAPYVGDSEAQEIMRRVRDGGDVVSLAYEYGLSRGKVRRIGGSYRPWKGEIAPGLPTLTLVERKRIEGL
jgi:hypothetical protein